MNRTGNTPKFVMNKIYHGSNVTMRTLQGGMCQPAGSCRITNASAHNPSSAIALCGQNRGNVTGIKKNLMAGNLTRSRHSGYGQFQEKKELSVFVP